MRLISNARQDTDDFFKSSGLFNDSKLTHSPFLVFLEDEKGVEVKIVNRSSDLFEFLDPTQVMAQWRGEWRSDWFQFTVGQARKALGK